MRVGVVSGALAAFVAFGSLSVAAAQEGSVSVKPLALAPKMQKQFEKNYGVREVETLSDYLNSALKREFAERGVSIAPDAPLSLEVTLLDAKPSKPTFEQLADKPGLDYFRSFSLGGAELQGRLIAADGSVVKEFTHESFEPFFPQIRVATTWSDAQQSIREFAEDAAKATAAAAVK